MLIINASEFRALINNRHHVTPLGFCDHNGALDCRSLSYIHSIADADNLKGDHDNARTNYVALFTGDTDPADGDDPEYAVTVYDFVQVLAEKLGIAGGAPAESPQPQGRPSGGLTDFGRLLMTAALFRMLDGKQPVEGGQAKEVAPAGPVTEAKPKAKPKASKKSK